MQRSGHNSETLLKTDLEQSKEATKRKIRKQLKLKEGAENLKKVAKDKKALAQCKSILKGANVTIQDLHDELQNLNARVLVDIPCVNDDALSPDKTDGVSNGSGGSRIEYLKKQIDVEMKIKQGAENMLAIHSASGSRKKDIKLTAAVKQRLEDSRRKIDILRDALLREQQQGIPVGKEDDVLMRDSSGKENDAHELGLSPLELRVEDMRHQIEIESKIMKGAENIIDALYKSGQHEGLNKAERRFHESRQKLDVLYCSLSRCIGELSPEQAALGTYKDDNTQPSYRKPVALTGELDVCIIGADRLLADVPNRDPRKRSAMASPAGKIGECTGPNKRERLSVPPEEIYLRGPLALEAYNKALSKGKTRVRRIPVMLIGQDRSGKTSLKKSLRGIRFNPDESSTVGIDVDPSYFKVTTEIWKTGEKDQDANTKDAISYEQHAARLVVKILKEENFCTNERSVESFQSVDSSLADMVTPSANTRDENSTVSSLEFIKIGHNEFPRDKQLDVSASPGTSKDSDSDGSSNLYNTPANQRTDLTNRRSNHLTTSKIPDEVETFIKKSFQEVDKLKNEDYIYSVLWDFGGQSVYYATHPLFLTSRALYLLAYDLSRELHKTAQPVTKQGVYKNIQDNFETRSNLDYLDFWMTSIASLASRDDSKDSDSKSLFLPEENPPIFLVCTNADRPYGGAEPLALAREVYDSLQGKSYKNHLFDVFVVDNTKSGGESECPEVARLRRSILAVAKELPMMKEDIPIKWLKYEKALQATLGKGHKWIYFEDAKRIAAEVCQIHDNQEFVTLLDFLHDQRILIHFDDSPELNKLVVLDPQWLIDVFKKVITVQLPDCHGKAETKQLWHKLETTGILEEKLLTHVWDPLIEPHETFESFIAIMEKFSLLCSWPSSDTSCNKQYLVPSMLMSHPPQDITELIASAELPSLFLKFEYGQVSWSLFPRLVLQFFQWGQNEFLSSLHPHLYKNFARFQTAGDEDCSVIFLCHSSFIEIVVHRGNVNPRLAEGNQSKLTISSDTHHDSFEVFCARTVYRQLSLMLECMRNEFYWLRNMTYQAGFICPVCCHGKLVNYCRIHHKQDCEQGECLHFLSESELHRANQFITCTRAAAAVNNKVHVTSFSAWFISPREQLLMRLMKDGCFLEKGLKTGLSPRFLAILLNHLCRTHAIQKKL
ncbi:uncharacterized protein [Montipora foliosa]|uniref:uncharacterized protein isoform X2 n=1 Tax=Montipora foliosa TaxID=591990 RepID=UPI0035F1E390